MKPIAIVHCLTTNRTYEFTYHAFLEWACDNLRNSDRRFYIEWLDRHNPREVINESEAGDE